MLKNLVRVTSSTTGTGTITLGSAVAGALSFSEASVPVCAVVSYGISDGSESEVGRGTYASGAGTLTRDTVLASTNEGNKIVLSGNEQVYITALAEDFERIEPAPISDHMANGTKADFVANENQAFGMCVTSIHPAKCKLRRQTRLRRRRSWQCVLMPVSARMRAAITY
jgi:hypothetical protein